MLVVSVFIARSELRKVLFLGLSVTFLFVYEISLEPLSGFAPNSQGRRLGVVASVVRRMNEVTVHWARLVLGWVTVFGQVYHHGV